MDEKGIDDILNGERDTIDVPAPEIIEQPPEAETSGQPRGPDGKFAPKGEKEAAPPAAEEERIPVSAVQDERRKRQELERRYADLEAKFQQFSQPPQPAPDMFEAPDQWQGHFKGEVTGEAVNQATFQSRLATSEMLAAQAFDDFGEVWGDLNEFIDKNPAIKEQALADRHPWAFAYKAFKNNQRATELGATNISELEAKIRAEVTEQIRAEMQQPQQDIPQTLAAAPSGRATNIPAAPPSLQDILK